MLIFPLTETAETPDTDIRAEEINQNVWSTMSTRKCRPAQIDAQQGQHEKRCAMPYSYTRIMPLPSPGARSAEEAQDSPRRMQAHRHAVRQRRLQRLGAHAQGRSPFQGSVGPGASTQALAGAGAASYPRVPAPSWSSMPPLARWVLAPATA